MAKQARSFRRGVERTLLSAPGVKPLKKILEAPAKEAERAAGIQQEAIGKQRQREQLRLAEAESEIGKRRLLSRVGGRRSLIASR